MQREAPVFAVFRLPPRLIFLTVRSALCCWGAYCAALCQKGLFGSSWGSLEGELAQTLHDALQVWRVQGLRFKV